MSEYNGQFSSMDDDGTWHVKVRGEMVGYLNGKFYINIWFFEIVSNLYFLKQNVQNGIWNF